MAEKYNSVLQARIDESIRLFRQYEPPEGYYLCFSGGKDSSVLYDIAKKSGVKFDIHYHYMTIEPPPLIDFIKEHYPEVPIEPPLKTMEELIIQKRIPPLRTMRYCCYYFKKRCGAGRIKVVGLRRAESSQRAKREIYEKNNRRKKNDYYLHPILDWTDKEIWQYITTEGLPYCRLYDEGRHRIGCVLCPFENWGQAQKDIKDFPEIAKYILNACRKSYEINKGAFTNNIPFNSGDDIFDWWLMKWQDIPEEERPSRLVDPDTRG